MSEHTKGPWLRDGRTVYALNEDGINRFSAGVQNPHTPEAELIAVATLMQSAPDMQEALEAAQKDLNDLSDFYVGHRGHNPSFAARITLTRRKVHAALAKAEGQS